MCVCVCVRACVWGAYDKFPDFFVWARLLIVCTWNSSPLRSNLLRLQCTYCTVPTTSGRPHGSPFVWACQWTSSQPFSSPQLSHKALQGAIHLIRWLANFYDFSFKWTATTGIGIHPTKTWLSLMVNFKNASWTRGHFRRTICNKLCFKLKLECFRLLLEQLEWIEHQFLSGIRHSRKAGSLWMVIRSVGGVRKSIHQSWLAKELGLGLGLLCWGFKGVQEEIPREEASTLQIGSVAFPPGQCTSPQLHPCHRLFDQDGYQDSSSPSL